MVMKMSKEGLALLKKLEGFKNHPYLDGGGVPTIGYGNTYYPFGGRVKMTDKPITLAEGESMLLQVLVDFESWVNKKVTKVLTQHQFDALLSFTYNVGKGAFNDSTLLKKVNKNPNDSTIDYEFKRWVYDNKVVVKGLKKRRNQESYHYHN